MCDTSNNFMPGEGFACKCMPGYTFNNRTGLCVGSGNNNWNNGGSDNNNNTNNEWWADNNNQESGASYGAVIAITLSVIACVALVAIVAVHAKKVAGRRRGEAVELMV